MTRRVWMVVSLFSLLLVGLGAGRLGAQEVPRYSVYLWAGVHPGGPDGYDQADSSEPFPVDDVRVVASLDARYRARAAPVFGLGFEYRPSPRWGIGLEGEWVAGKAKGDMTLRLSVPEVPGFSLEARGSRDDFTYRRVGANLYGAAYLNSTLGVLGGLSLHSVTVEAVSDVDADFDRQVITRVDRKSDSGVVFGGFAGLRLGLPLGERLVLELQPRVYVRLAGAPKGPFIGPVTDGVRVKEDFALKRVGFRVVAGLRLGF
jgi:hypothetical protein